MRPFSGIPALPADICRQIQLLLLTEDERRDVASSLTALLAPRRAAPVASLLANRNAPQPDWQRGV